MASLFLAEATTWTHEQLVQIVREQLAVDYDRLAGNLRTAVMYSPKEMTANKFVAAAAECGVNPITARRQFHQARQEMKEMDGE